MRRVWLALMALLAASISVPAQAFSQMNVQDCDAAWQMVTQGQPIRHSLSKDGWCLAENLMELPFERFEWRAEGLERVLQDRLPPTGLAIRVTDPDMLRILGVKVAADAPAMPLQITLLLRQNAPDKQVIIQQLKIAGPKDNVVTLQGTFDDVDLTSTAKMQISLGSAKLRDVTILGYGNRQLEPYLRPYIGNTFPERSRKRSAMIKDVSDWPSHNFPDATKQAVKQLIATLPAPNGILRVEVDSGAGLSAALFVQAFVFGNSATQLSERILNNTIFHATWTANE